MSRTMHFAAWVACTAVVAGCSGDDDGAPIEPVSSAGVPVAIAPEATLSLGVATGDTLQEFGNLATPLLLPEGRLAVPLRIA